MEKCKKLIKNKKIKLNQFLDINELPNKLFKLKGKNSLLMTNHVQYFMKI